MPTETPAEPLVSPAISTADSPSAPNNSLPADVGRTDAKLGDDALRAAFNKAAGIGQDDPAKKSAPSDEPVASAATSEESKVSTPVPEAGLKPPADKIPAEKLESVTEKAGSKSKDSTTIKDGDEDVTVTLADARRALLRDRVPATLLSKMSRQELLDLGAARMLAQRVNDRFSRQAGEWRRIAEANGKGDAPKPDAKVAEAAPVAPPVVAPQAVAPVVTPVAPSVAQTNAKWADQIKAIRDAAGDDIANPLELVINQLTSEIASSHQGALAGKIAEIESRYDAQLNQRTEQFNQQIAATQNILMDTLFRDSAQRLEKDFPQLKDKTARDEIKQTWIALASSGRFQNPFATFDEIAREACFACFGNQNRETFAHQLAERQEMQSRGQVDTTSSRAMAPAKALTPREISDQAVAMLKQGKNPQEVDRHIASLLAS